MRLRFTSASLRTIAYALILVTVVLVCVQVNMNDPAFSRSDGKLARVAFSPDIWWQIVTGKQILTTGQVPTRDAYSFTASNSKWIAYQWLADVLLAAAAAGGGLWALTALLVFLSSSLVLLLFYYAYLRTHDVQAAFLASLLALPALSVSVSLRPQLMGYCWLLLTLVFLERYRSGSSKRLWVLPLLFLFWVNMHGTFPFGLLAIGLYWLGGLKKFARAYVAAEPWTAVQRRHMCIILLLCVLALAITPYGTQLAAYPLQIALLQPVNVGVVEEWHPLALDTAWGKSVLGLVLLFFFLQVLRPMRWRVDEVLLLGFAVYGSFVHRRMIFLLAIILAPLLAVHLEQWLPRPNLTKNRFVVIFLLLLAAGTLIALYPSPSEVESALARHYPREATNYLRTHQISAPVFNQGRWGGYLVWALGPEQKVFLDGRLDIFEYAGVLSDYLEISKVRPHSLHLLEHKYKIRTCLLLRDAPLATVLEALPDWKRVYADELSVIYVHD